MDLFQKYDGYMLERKAYKSQKGFKKVEIYKMQVIRCPTLSVTVFMLTLGLLKR